MTQHDEGHRPLANAEEWNERYRGDEDQIWSGQPNGSLLIEVTPMPAGRALDIGCGEGADAIWLAANGWRVTAVDISDVAIERCRVAAAEAGVEVDWRCVDVIAEPPMAETYDLVAASYPALRQPEGLAAVRPLADAIRPGGQMLVIGHDVADSAEAADHGFDPADYVSIDDIIDDLHRIFGDEFTIELDDVRHRPDAPEGARHINDRVFRARRSERP